MRAKREGEALVERNDYDVYSMADVEQLPDCKVIVVIRVRFRVWVRHKPLYDKARRQPNPCICCACAVHALCMCCACAAMRRRTPILDSHEFHMCPSFARVCAVHVQCMCMHVLCMC